MTGLLKVLEAEDYNGLLKFGAKEQRQVSDYSNYLSEQMARLDDSNVRGHLGELLSVLSRIDLKPFSKRKFLFWELPPRRPSLQQSGQFQKMLVELDYVAHRLEKAHGLLLQEIEGMERFYEENQRYGEAVNRLLESGRRAYVAWSAAARDPVFLELVDGRLYDLQMSGQLALQKGAQIRMLQDSHRRLALKIQSSILNTIPLWQDQLSLALTLERQGQVAGDLSAFLAEQGKLVAALQEVLEVADEKN